MTLATLVQIAAHAQRINCQDEGARAVLASADNPSMAQSTAERQKAFKDAQRAAGMVRLEAYVTQEQREKFRALGGDAWLRKKIDAGKVKAPNNEA